MPEEASYPPCMGISLSTALFLLGPCGGLDRDQPRCTLCSRCSTTLYPVGSQGDLTHIPHARATRLGEQDPSF